MKRIFAIMVAVIAFCGGRSAAETNAFGVYAGGSINHFCADTYGATGSFGWGGGAFVGGVYDIRFNSHWSLTPAVEIGYTNNGAITPRGWSEGGRKSSWRDYWQVNIPVLANYRVMVGSGVVLRIGAGVYFSEAFAVRCYDLAGSEKVTYHTRDGYRAFEDRFNLGVAGEFAVETGRHWSYTVGVRYPLKKYNVQESTLNLSLGVRYTF